jgi:hypothetical protein
MNTFNICIREAAEEALGLYREIKSFQGGTKK